MGIIFKAPTLTILCCCVIETTIGSKPTPFLHYDMNTENCHKGIFLNTGILELGSMELLRNRNTTICSNGIGIERRMSISDSYDHGTDSQRALYGSKEMGSIWEQWDNETICADLKGGVSISLWIRPHRRWTIDPIERSTHTNEATFPMTIFTIGAGTTEAKTNPTIARSCEVESIDFQLSIVEKDVFEIKYRTNEVLLNPCQRLEVNVSNVFDRNEDIASSSRPTHLMISLTNYNQQVFANGKLVVRRREPFHARLEHWNPSSLLQFFNDPTGKQIDWDGQLFQFSIYRGVYDKYQVRSIFGEGLPSSQPFAHSKLVHINEDAIDEEGKYQYIQLSYSYLDEEVDNLLGLFGVTHHRLPGVRHYITRFPSKGYLYHLDDERQIEPNENYPVLVTSSDRLVYIPGQNEHSAFPGQPYSSFDFCVTKMKILRSAQCVSAKISVIVQPVNDPPIAVAPPVYQTYEGTREDDQPLRLTGVDVDKNDVVECIQITSPPKFGFLFLSVPTFRSEVHLFHGTMLSNLNNTISGAEAFVEYRFTDYDHIVVGNSVVTDFFRFRVKDSFGTWSSDVEAQVEVLSSLSSFSDQHSSTRNRNFFIPPSREDETNISLEGSDFSGINRSIGFLVTSPPAHGIMYDDKGTPVVENEIFISNNSFFDEHGVIHGEASVSYNENSYACIKSENYEVDEKFQYRIVALDDKNEIMSMSPTDEKHFRIKCPVEPISINLSRQAAIESFTFLSWSQNICNGYQLELDAKLNPSCTNLILTFGIHLTNVEKLQEPVLVLIKSQGGLISLKQDSILDINPLLHQPIMRSSIRFLVPSKKIERLLSTIYYQSDRVGTDTIDVVMQYGRCNHKANYLVEHDFSQPTAECLRTEKSIQIEVHNNATTGLQLLHYPFPWVSVLVITILGPIFYLKGRTKEKLGNTISTESENLADEL